MKQITIEQQQMLEDLTGLQHTRTGRVRKKQNRSYEVTKNLGLISQYHRQQQRLPEPDPNEPGYKLKMLLRGIKSHEL
jgi:hypothetical protein